MSNILSLSACLVLSLLIASPIDCSALVIDDDRLTGGHAVPAGQTQAGFQLAKRYTLASLPGSGIFSEQFQKARFSNGLWVPLHFSFCPLHRLIVVLHLIIVTTGCPTKCYLTLLAYSDSLHLPLLTVHIHTFCLYWHFPCRRAWLCATLMFSGPSSFMLSALCCVTKQVDARKSSCECKEDLI